MDDERWSRFEERRARLAANQARIAASTVDVRGARVPASRALKQPEVTLQHLLDEGGLTLEIRDGMLDVASLETGIKYEGYLRRQQQAVDRLRKQEDRRIPPSLDFAGIPGLSREMVERLTTIRPSTLGQALRIPGVTPAAIAVVAAHVMRSRDSEPESARGLSRP